MYQGILCVCQTLLLTRSKHGTTTIPQLHRYRYRYRMLMELKQASVAGRR